MKKATQLYVCKCLPFSTHVWEKPLTCLFPPELSVKGSAETNERKSNLEQAALSDAALIAKVVTAGLSNYVLKILIRK